MLYLMVKTVKVNKVVVEMNQKHVIELSPGPCNAPLLLIRNKDGPTGFCVDLHRLNDAAKKDLCTLPWIHNTLNTSVEVSWLSAIDVRNLEV